jgi:hypothetical protein
MSNPYEQYNSGQQPTDPAAPTQYMPVGDQQAQFGQQAPQQPQFGQQPQAQYGQQPVQQPQYGGQQQQYGQPPAFGAAPAWGQGAPQQQPQQPYAGYPNAAMQPVKAKRSGAAAVGVFLLRTIVGRVVIFLVVAGAVAGYHFATSHPAQRGNSGQVSQAGSMQAWDLKVGDCFDKPTTESDIQSLTAIPCTEAHDAQVFAEPKIKESSYPGEATMSDEAGNDCGDETTQSTISQDTPDSVDLSAFYAQNEDTFNGGDDFVTCYLVSDSKNLTKSYVTGS